MIAPPNTGAMALIMLAITVEMTLSANLLNGLGINYVSEGGFCLEKIHPGTYLAAAAMLARLAPCWRAGPAAPPILPQGKYLFGFLAAMVFCILYAAVLSGIGNIIALIDSFLAAGMLAAAVLGITPRQATQLRRLILTCMLVNGVIALMEAASGARLIAFSPAIPQLPADFRPTALYDHPLTGAAVTMMGIVLAATNMRPTGRALPLAGGLLAALLAFGGRAALLVTLLVGGARYGADTLRAIRCRTLSWRHAMPLVLSGAVLLLAGVVISLGLVPRLQGHVYWDGSAQSRLDEFQILRLLSPAQFWLGCPRADLLALIEPLRLQASVDVIENFWLLMLISLGMLCFPVFCLGMWLLLRHVWQQGNAGAKMIILACIVVASTSNSLGRKSNVLVVAMACVACTTKTEDRKDVLF